MRILPHPSPNRGPRRDGARPSLVVLHYTAMASPEAALERLCEPAAEVSAHYLLARDGTVFSLVSEKDRAWHAGAGAWGAVTDVNSHSIGIELDNAGDAPFAAPLMASLEALLAALLARHCIPPERVIGHADVAPMRKRDPGPRFDWRRLAQGGLSVWPDRVARDDRPSATEAFLRAARAFGYPADVAPGFLLKAFRDRFRPDVDGPPTRTDDKIMAALARRWPVDGPASVP